MLLNLPCPSDTMFESIKPHRTFNYSKGRICNENLYEFSEEDILAMCPDSVQRVSKMKGNILHLANIQFISIGSARRQLNFRRQKDGGVKTYASSLRPKSVAAPSQLSQEVVASCSSKSVSKRRLFGSFEELDSIDVPPCKATVSVDSSIVSSQIHQKRSRGSDESFDSTDVPPCKLPLGSSEGCEVNVDASEVVTLKDSVSIPLEQRSDSSTCIMDVDVSACVSDNTAVQDNTNVIVSKNIPAHIPSSSSKTSDASGTRLQFPITAQGTTPRVRSSSSGPADFGSSDEAVTYFTDMLQSAALNCIPKTSGHFPNCPVPWWSPVWTTAVRKCAAFCRLRRNRGDPTLLEDFRRARARTR
ncbi:hypothetical protein Pcinc_017001 [Petrolisthes cinctipes]|uniref:Uncharacterized protein n=1 Tax=Petrolisthes cinctipes TaxID=88211 RepID=A0AAE1FSH8_PETCI|nr:hypothetical protein Pcinc_017001 [Petrolisthes cinctipes]